jgi:RND family efflux transporter MFP subunit
MKMIWIVGLAMFAAGCSGGSPDEGNSAEPVALVTLARVEQAALVPRTIVYGGAEAGPMGKRALAAPAEAVVVAIDAPVGTAVRRGEVIARLAASPTMRADMAKAGIDAQQANAALARAQRLRIDGLNSNADVEAAAAAARTANAVRASLSKRAGAMTLRAPVSGVVDALNVTVGDLIQPGAAVASVSSAGDLRVRFGVDPGAARALRPGMPLVITAGAGRPLLTVPIQAIDPVADPQTRLNGVFATVPAASGIVIGEALTAVVGSSKPQTGPTIPYAALLDDGGQSYVFVVGGGVAHRRDVKTGTASGDRVAVLAGLKPGETVVVEGGTAIEDGMKVRTR